MGLKSKLSPHFLDGTTKTLPKAQRTRGSSSSCQSNFLRSYHKFKHESWSHFIFRISTKHQLNLSTKHQNLKVLTKPFFRISKKIQLNITSTKHQRQIFANICSLAPEQGKFMTWVGRLIYSILSKHRNLCFRSFPCQHKIFVVKPAGESLTAFAKCRQHTASFTVIKFTKRELGRYSKNQNGNLRWHLPWRGGGVETGLECHIPSLKIDFFKNHLE